jgi:predicted cupin superfamily sugar epimerase
MQMQDAAEIVRALGMQRHPEGGWYVEIHRSHVRVRPLPLDKANAHHGDRNLSRDAGDGHRSAGANASRAAMTSIYYLLERGQRSHWHRVDADELWAWHAGAPMELSIAAADDARGGQRAPTRAPGGGMRTVTVHRLGMNLAGGERPQAVVPAHAWQSAQPLGDWSLLGCVVAPGFEFAHFEMAPPDWSP